MDKIKELKAQAYDCLLAIENWQRKLAEINQAITQLQQQETPVKESK